MLADYLKAAIPTPTTILGQSLRAFSLGHNLILLRHENTFLDGEKKLKEGDLLTGIFTCCWEYDEALEQLERKDLKKLLSDWAEQVGEFNFRKKAAEFARYLVAASALPDLIPIDDGKEGRTPGAPFLQQVKVTLMGEVGYSRWEALNVPLGEALHDYFAYWERKGRAKIIGPDEQAHLDGVEDVRKAIEEEKAKGASWHAL